MAKIVFIHGLNTFGDGLIHVGPLTFGAMHANWKEALEKRGEKFIAIEGLGFGSPADQAERAIRFLESHEGEFHLLGHSVGGLVARTLACNEKIAKRIRSVMTIATPHRGAAVAQVGMRLSKKNPVLHRMLKQVGYDSSIREEIFAHFTPEKCHDLPDPEAIRKISFLCAIEKERLSPFLRSIYSRLHDSDQKSDGFIFCESQKWGEVRDSFELDHFDEIGCHLYLSRKRKTEARLEFERLVEAVVAATKET